MQGAFLGSIISFSLFSWVVGFYAVKYEMFNHTTGQVIQVKDIVLTYQSMLFGMFTIINILGIIPAVVKALLTARQVVNVIER